MKNIIRSLIAVSLLSLATIITSCSNTKLLSSSYPAKDIKLEKGNKILVVALMTDKDKMLRENMENVLVETLRAQGINAGSSVSQFGPDAFKALTERATMEKIKSEGYDKTFTVALLTKTKQKSYRPGYLGITPYHYGFWGYYNYYYNNYYNGFYPGYYRPGYYAADNKFVLEGSVYSVNENKAIYSAQTKTMNPSSPHALAAEFTKTLVNDMVKNGVFTN